MNNDFQTPENENINETENFVPQDTAPEVPAQYAVQPAGADAEVCDVSDACTKEEPTEFLTSPIMDSDVQTYYTEDDFEIEILSEPEEISAENQEVSPASSAAYYNPSINYGASADTTGLPVYQQAPAFDSAQSEQSVQGNPEKKENRGSTAFLVVLWILVGLFATGFFGLCGYVIGISNNNTDTSRPTLFQEETTAPSTEAELTEEEKPEATLPDAKPEPDKNDLYSDSTAIQLKAPPSDQNNTAKYTTQYAYKKVANSTIGVVCYEEGFFDDPASEGTGIILSEDGYIATNSHVIGDSRSLYSVQVVTPDNQKYSATVIGYDSRTDIAVLKINAKGLTPAEFCDSEYVEVGQDVIAVGNPGGMDFQNSLTRGVVSALDRELDLSSQVSYIQTDAAINPGNSGGPLCNMYGQVIGINTAKISSESYEGMGFAIPSVLIKEITDDLIANGYVHDRVRLGISGQAVTSSMMQYYDIPAGILVGEISEGGPCDNSGLQRNDVITAIDDEEVESFSDVYGILAKHKPGDKVVLSVYRISSKSETKITITLMADEGETQQ